MSWDSAKCIQEIKTRTYWHLDCAKKFYNISLLLFRVCFFPSQMASVTPERKFHVYTTEELEDVISAIGQQA